MAVTVGELVAKLRADLSGWTPNLDQAERSAQSFVTNSRRALLTLSASFASTILAVRNFTRAVEDNFQQARALAAVSGLSAEAADNLADTFDLLGFNSDSLTLALFRLGQQVDEGGDAIRRLGISFRDSTGAMKSEGALLLEVRDRISAMGNASERSAALMELFGRAGRSLAPAFALSREEFQRFMQEASAISPWSAEMQQRAQDLSVAMNRLAQSWRAVREAIALAVAEPLGKFFDSISEGLRRIREGPSLQEMLSLQERGLAELDPISRFFGHEERIRAKIELIRELIREVERARAAASRGAPHAGPAGPTVEFFGERAPEEALLPAELPLLAAQAAASFVDLEARLHALNFVEAANQAGSLSDRLRGIGEDIRTVSLELDPAILSLARLDEQLRQNRVLAAAMGTSFNKLGGDLDAATTALKELVAQGLGPASEEFRIVASRVRALSELQSLKAAFDETFGAITRALGGMVTGILQGTQDLGEAIERMGQNIAISLVESIVNRALKQIQDALWQTILQTLEMQSLLGIGGIVPAITSSVVPSPFGGPLIEGAQEGGVAFGSPRPIMVHPPEALIPLERVADFASRFGGVAGTSVQQVFNVSPGTPEAIRRELWAMMPIFRKAAVDAVIHARNQGGSMARAMGQRRR